MPGPFKHSVEERTIPLSVVNPPVGLLTGALRPPATKYRSNEGSTLLYSRLENWDGTSRLVIATHGHGANSSQFGQNAGPGLGVMALARTGRYVVLSIDGGPTFTEWGSPMAMSAIRDARDWARSIGVKVGKYAGHGWSMGGITQLTWMRRDVDCVGAWLWVPAIDLDYFNSTAGYVPDYGIALPNNATWSSEIGSNSTGAYRAASAMQTAVNVPASTAPIGSGATIALADARRFNDCLTGRKGVGINGAPVSTYGSKDDTHLYDVISTGAAYTTTVGNNAVQNFGTSDLGYNPYREYADFTPAAFGANRKVALALTSDDATIPPAIADAWLAKVNNPNIAPTAKSKTLGNHTMMFGYYTDQEIVDFYDSLDWS